ncbi:hypothetical protein FZW96_13640 [Bacillus sp. BGMRC 2118]|nr:hypothetical protein FZW96_13640 [Bacillus sp. BGMRC 2118]
MKRKISVSIIVLIVLFVLWWVKCVYFIPQFQNGPNKSLVSADVRLELVTDSPEPEKLGVIVPKFIPFWKTVGKVEGEIEGTLWEFTSNGDKYVLYSAKTEMPWRYIYKYTEN